MRMTTLIWAGARAEIVAACRAIWRRRWSLAAGLAYGMGVNAAFLAGFALANGAISWSVALIIVASLVHFAFILWDGMPFPAADGDSA